MADETVHFTFLSSLQAEHYNKTKGAKSINHKRTNISDHAFNHFYKKYTLDIDTLIATKYPTMTFYINDQGETKLSSSVDNNCSMPMSIKNNVKGIDITPACRAHDYCYMSNNRFSINIEKSYETCNENFRKDLLALCEKRFKSTGEKDCDNCDAHKEESATNNSFSIISTMEDSVSAMRRSFHHSGCRSSMSIIEKSVSLSAYNVFLNSQERAAQLTLDLLKLANKNKNKNFYQDLKTITSVNLKEMAQAHVNYCFSIVQLGLGGDYKSKSLAQYDGEVYQGFKVENDLGKFNACNEENKKIVSQFLDEYKAQ